MLDEVTNFCRLILFRHPELHADDAGRAVGAGPAQLSRRGRESVLEWLDLLADVELAGVHCSSQPQCADAAGGIAAAKGLEIEVDERLRDQELGEWQGRTWEEVATEQPDRVRDFFADFGEVVAPNGESLGQAIERFYGWWGDLRPVAAGSAHVVVASGAMITGFVAALLGMRLSRSVCLQLPHGGSGVVDVYDNGARITTWNPSAISRA